MDETMKVKLEGFEGPLDLLLHLIKKLEIDIYDIPMVLITEQYMQYVQAMKELHLDSASKYMVMAATLLSIKSKMLLPVEEARSEEADYEDPRQELVDQLLEYQKFKEASKWFDEAQEQQLGYYTRETTDISQYVTDHSLTAGLYQPTDLMKIMNHILQVKQDSEPPVKTVNKEAITIEQQMGYIETQLQHTPHLTYQEQVWQHSLTYQVTTFLATLELAKKQRVTLRQPQQFATLYIDRKEEMNGSTD